MLFGYLYFFFGWLPRQILSAFRKELTPILLKLFHKIAEEGTLPNSYYEATITLITKTKQRHYTHTHTHTHTHAHTHTKAKANITYEHRHKNLQHNTSKPNPMIHEKDHTP